MSISHARSRTARKPTAKKTISVDLALIKTFAEYFRLWSGDEDVWNCGAEADRYRSHRFGLRMARHLALLLRREETREAVAQALTRSRLPATPEVVPVGAQAMDDAAAVAALGRLIARKAAAAAGEAELGHARLDLLAIAAALYGPEAGNVERHRALRDAGLLANDNATDAKAAA